MFVSWNRRVWGSSHVQRCSSHTWRSVTDSFYSMKRYTTASTTALTELTAINPIDGRYARHTKVLRDIFSEFALIRNRIIVETRWLEHLANNQVLPASELKPLSQESMRFLQDLRDNFDVTDAERVKEIESVTNHDLKSVEYYIKEQLEKLPTSNELNKQSEFIHFGCTSEDMNNLSYALMLKDVKTKVMLPEMTALIKTLVDFADVNKTVPMLSRTHGQSATPTTVGKEFANFAFRLSRQRHYYEQVPILGKLNGAVGDFAALTVTNPDVNWEQVSKDFIKDLGIDCNPYTTQIEPHDFIAETSDCVSRFNTVLLDLNRDLWGYVSLNYLSQSTVKEEVGSSTMPHKVNPIDFENSEGNLGLANALFGFFKEKLPISRFQRDLSDSTVLRSLGAAFGYSLIAYKSLDKGLGKIVVNHAKLEADLADNVEVLAEPVQMVLRRFTADAQNKTEEKPYEKLKSLTRGRKLTLDDMRAFISTLELPPAEKARLLELSPATYTGIASKQGSREAIEKALAEHFSKT